jgi:hypothetical protein
MSEQIKTTEDGWDCVPELMDAVRCIEEIGHDIYEIKNCKRASDLDGIVSNMIDHLHTAIFILKDIDTDVEYITVEEED